MNDENVNPGITDGSSTPRSDGSYDYNCDGVDEPVGEVWVDMTCQYHNPYDYDRNCHCCLDPGELLQGYPCGNEFVISDECAITALGCIPRPPTTTVGFQRCR